MARMKLARFIMGFIITFISLIAMLLKLEWTIPCFIAAIIGTILLYSSLEWNWTVKTAIVFITLTCTFAAYFLFLALVLGPILTSQLGGFGDAIIFLLLAVAFLVFYKVVRWFDEKGLFP